MDNNTMVAVTPDEYLIRKGGAYYRPNAAGYTMNVAEAGRYSLEDAIRHSHPNGPDGPRDGIDYMPAPPACHQSGRTGAGEALDKRIFLTCVSGDGPTPYLKVHFNTLADAHAAHDQLLGRKGNI